MDGTPRRSVYAGAEVWSDYGNTWTQAQALYTYAGLDRPVIRTGAGGTAYYHADALGSVVAVTNAAGAVTASARYAAFGQTLSGGNLPRYRYAGREPDATGLIYYRARYYDPTLGRFTQRDPAGFADGVNPYAYVGNNPVSFTDPLGLAKLAPVASPNVSAYPGISGGNAAVVGTTIAAELPPLATSLPKVQSAITRYVTPILQGGARALATGPGAVLVGTLFPSSLGNPEANWKPSDAGFLPFTSNVRDSVYTADQAKSGVHKNSLDYIGDTHVYQIKGPDGSTYKIGESAQGTRVRDGESMRAEQQVRNLTRETGDRYESEIRKIFPDKASARDYETRLIERLRRMYGQDTLPGNKTNR